MQEARNSCTMQGLMPSTAMTVWRSAEAAILHQPQSHKHPASRLPKLAFGPLLFAGDWQGRRTACWRLLRHDSHSTQLCTAR
jgi:hypothetical protein